MRAGILLTAAFIVMVLAQWYIPGRMVFHNERVLATGRPFKFRTEPVDPYDLFRGNYVHLDFMQDEVHVDHNYEALENKEHVYGLLSTDKEGYAVITKLLPEAPAGNIDYLKLKISYIAEVNFKSIAYIEYPFERFYMNEYKAPGAEAAYRQVVSDTSQVAYAIVYIKDGEAVLKDVMLNDKPIREAAGEITTPK